MTCSTSGTNVRRPPLVHHFSPATHLTVSRFQVFNWLSNLSTITGLLTWMCINVSFLRFYYGCKRQGIDRSAFPFVAPFQPYCTASCLSVCSERQTYAHILTQSRTSASFCSSSWSSSTALPSS